MRVALDAMGGDGGPGPFVAGAVRAVRDEKALRVTLVGDADQLRKHLADCDGEHNRLDIFSASQFIAPDDRPTTALRIKPDSSIARCWQLVAERKVEAMVSAGNRTALADAGLRLQRFLRHVQKPGLAAVIPTLKGPAVLIDVAANLTPTASQLYQYGVMGAMYARHILRQETIALALLNTGNDASRSFELTRQTLALFQNSPWQPNFVGRIDGQDVHRGLANVIVSDAFIGGMLLQMWDGVFDFARQLAAGPVGEYPLSPSHASTGGALLGVESICLTCRPDADGVHSALLGALQHATVGLNERIVETLETGPLAPTG